MIFPLQWQDKDNMPLIFKINFIPNSGGFGKLCAYFSDATAAKVFKEVFFLSFIPSTNIC